MNVTFPSLANEKITIIFYKLHNYTRTFIYICIYIIDTYIEVHCIIFSYFKFSLTLWLNFTEKNAFVTPQ
jgi:hypothetical protein